MGRGGRGEIGPLDVMRCEHYPNSRWLARVKFGALRGEALKSRFHCSTSRLLAPRVAVPWRGVP
jgi:hypothetical protein